MTKKDILECFHDINFMYNDCSKYDTLSNLLDKLERESKTGHWIMHLDDLFPVESTMECSECGEHQPITIDNNYCPNCGCKMESEG